MILGLALVPLLAALALARDPVLPMASGSTLALILLVATMHHFSVAALPRPAALLKLVGKIGPSKKLALFVHQEPPLIVTSVVQGGLGQTDQPHVSKRNVPDDGARLDACKPLTHSHIHLARNDVGRQS